MRSPFRDDLEDCVLAKEIERQLNCVDTDMRDPYNPIVRSIRLAEEILDATD